MTEQPEALRLADLLESCPLTVGDAQQAVAAAELRRLHEENELNKALVLEAQEMAIQLSGANQELLALVKRYRAGTPLGHQPHMIADEADAALAKHGGAA
jgi:hypothetical protein